MTLKLSVLLSICVITYLLAPLVFTCDIQDPYNISLLVYNSYVKPVNVTYSTSIKYRGILLGAMRKIQADPSKDFTFTTEDNLDYGPFLVSVNGMAGTLMIIRIGRFLRTGRWHHKKARCGCWMLYTKPK
ncbi:hypothetical protein HF521_002853 [Silurus meridionalis]|uniref:Uncharacterized protein n=1 Tax=Silurus meridionalis TaxID=175797 RepID=A0A8T0B321_SILME|nr:hypothetical protein HF521_002853 [Silurus meridionalis]